MSRLIKYSEIFGSTFQGEGLHTGKLTNWCRLFACNLNCDGFGQCDPTDPSTYVLPVNEFDISNITKMEELPVFTTGCDSGYSWSRRFEHLAYEDTAENIAAKLTELNVNEYNPKGEWNHPVTDQEIHLCFTGGEPLMPRGQDAIIEIIGHLVDSGNYPVQITFETNATQKLKPVFVDFLTEMHQQHDISFTFSMSPKLFNVSGEPPQKAWKPDIIMSYATLANKVGSAYVKFVVNEKGIDELAERTTELKHLQHENDVFDLGFWAMPVGATLEGQNSHDVAFYEKLIHMGYNISDRVHVRIFGNCMSK